MTKSLGFKSGLLDGLPIAIGYLSVSFGFGVMAASLGFSPFVGMLIAGTNLASAGQVAGVTIIATAGTLFEMFLAQLVINMRYALMALSLTQKLDSSFTTGKRLICSMFITDELFAVASTKGRISTSYYLGLALLPYIGWTLGTGLGGFAGEILPVSLSQALGIAIYGMFIAVFIPPLKKSVGVLIAVAASAALSCAIKYIPALSQISDGFAIILCAVAAAALAAIIKPIPVNETVNDNGDIPSKTKKHGSHRRVAA